MALCEGKRGLFSLYDCKKEANHQCKQCQRALCNEHIANDKLICYECLANQEDGENAQDLQSIPYKLRDKMMRSKEFRPIHFGDKLSEYYNAFDARTFSVELASVVDVADSPDELFFDS